MTDKTDMDDNVNIDRALREAAENQLTKSPVLSPELKDQTPEMIIHELHVHQIELELQNEELKRVQLELVESRDKYQDLYDFAPIAYFTLNHKGIIKDVNLTGGSLLGTPRPKLLGRGFGNFVAAECLEKWDQHVLAVLGNEEKHSCVLTLKCQDGSSFYARLESIFINSPAEQQGEDNGGHVIRTAVSDITQSKLLENALLLSEERFRSLFEAIGEGVAIFRAKKDGEDFVFLDFNEAAEEIDQISRSQVIGRSVLEVFPSVREFGLFNVFQRVWRTGIAESSPIKKYKDNRIQRWRENYVYKLPSGEIAAVFSDETARIIAAEASKNTQERLDLVLKGADLGSWDLDILQGRAVVNEQAANIIGYRLDEIEPTLNFWQTLLHPDDVPHTLSALQDHLAGHTDSFGSEYRVRSKSGEYKWVLARGKVMERDAGGRALRVTGTYQDISDRKRVEEQEQRLIAAVDHAAEGIIITDATGIIEYINPAEETITGYSHDELIGQKPNIFKSDKQDNNFYKNLWGTINAGNVWFGRFINRKKDGTEYHEDATISPVYDKSGNLTNFVAVKHDVTKQLELQEQLFQAQKMEAIGTLAGGFAHDFNNKLQVIGGYVELMLFNADLPENFKHDVEIIKQAVDSSAELIKGMMVFSRKTPIELQPIALNKLVVQTRSMLSRSIPKTVQIDLLLADDLWTIKAAPNQIDQILMNLAINASDAMPDGGSLTIETKNIVLDQEYFSFHTIVRPGRYVLIEVSDTGTGMDKETASHIFEPFFTTKGPGKGTGLGLSVVYGIVEQHGGIIICDSKPSKGTTFRIYFPAIEEVYEEQYSEKKKPPRGQGETILLVDDEPDFLELAGRTLNRANYTVIQAFNGKKALNLYEKHRAEIRLVIMDLLMPWMSGKQCLEALRKLDPNVRVLIASEAFNSEIEADLKEIGAKGLIAKPFDTPQLIEKIREIIDED
jgi:PAS domain S-box-containing protein